jgi:hypothetical protein
MKCTGVGLPRIVRDMDGARSEKEGFHVDSNLQYLSCELFPEHFPMFCTVDRGYLWKWFQFLLHSVLQGNTHLQDCNTKKHRSAPLPEVRPYPTSISSIGRDNCPSSRELHDVWEYRLIIINLGHFLTEGSVVDLDLLAMGYQ